MSLEEILLSRKIMTSDPEEYSVDDTIPLEHEVERLLNATGSLELYNKWSTMTEDLPLKTQVEKLTQLHLRRREVMAKDIPSEINIAPSAPDFFIEALKQEMSGATELGRGNNGYVLTDPNNLGMAYKFLLRPPIGHQNTLAEEATMQGIFYEISKEKGFENVGVPFIRFFSIDSRLATIGMERLRAVSVKDILDGKSELPQGTDVDKIFTDLGMFLKHANEIRGIYHLDIRPGNIMISTDQRDKSYPNIFLIDMGLSKHKREVRSVKMIENGVFITKVDGVSDYGSMTKVLGRLKKFIKERN